MGRRGAAEVPWYVRSAQRQEQWRETLRKRGITFAIGRAPCKDRSQSACLRKADASWVSGDARACDAVVTANESTGARSEWSGWRVPDVLRERGADVGDPSLYLPMLRKLEAGQPITLLALGSSVVGAHAGCTAAWPSLKHCPCPRCCGSRCGRWGGGGWALRLLARINATWPHPGHRLYNLGEPGGDLMPSILACPASYMSFAPDMIMLDFFTAYHGGHSALIYERLVRLLLGGARSHGGGARSPARAQPVVTFVNFFEFADRHHAKSTYTSMGSQLAAALAEMRRSGGGGQTSVDEVSSLWHATSPARVTEAAALVRAWARRAERDVSSTDVWRNWWRDSEVRALQVAYRLPAVSLFGAFGAEFESHAHGLHVRDFACYDGLHPNHDGRSEAMVSDLLWHSISRGLDAARKLPPTAQYELPPPLQSLPRRVGHVCFTFDSEGWQMLTGERRTNRKLHEQSLIQTLQAPRIIANSGWTFVMYEPQSRTPFKPGIVANAPGSRLTVEIDTSRVRRPSSTFQYLESKVGMGVALLECSNCKCEPTRIDGTGAVARLSTLATREVRVSSHERCQLTLTLLNHTGGGADGGGESKFKLARMFVTGEDASSADGSGDASPLPGSADAGGGSDRPRRGCRGALGPYCAIRRQHREEMRRTPAEELAWREVAGGVQIAEGASAAGGSMRKRRNEALAMLRAAREARKNEAGQLSLQLLLPPS